MNRLDTVTDPAGRAYTHAYDANGNRASLAHPNGVETAYTYDTLNRLTSLATTHPGLSRTIQTYAFTLGPAGNRTRIVEAAGLPQQRTLDYTYDNLYRLTGETVTESLGLAYAKTFAYDPVGNRLTQTTALGPAGSPGPTSSPARSATTTTTRDRLLTDSSTPSPPPPTPGTPTATSPPRTPRPPTPGTTRTASSRSPRPTAPSSSTLYDPDGNRVRTSVTPPAGPTTTTHFLVDTSGGLSHVVAETDGTGTLQAYYVRGDDLLAVMRPLVPTPNPRPQATGRPATSTPTASAPSDDSPTRPPTSPTATPTPPSASSSLTPAPTPSPTPSPVNPSTPTRASSTTEQDGWIPQRGGSRGWIPIPAAYAILRRFKGTPMRETTP